MARIRYDAFISYRHSEPDSEIAARLHKKLESFRLPKTVAAKIRKTRLHRVFRDEAELAVSDDLSQAIETALQNSVIRLVAAMFGVGYDDLMQIAICVFFLFKISKQNDEIIKQNEEISRQNEEITRRYADRLKYYLINPVTYEELIALADKEITGYSPDERVKEKYGLE